MRSARRPKHLPKFGTLPLHATGEGAERGTAPQYVAPGRYYIVDLARRQPKSGGNSLKVGRAQYQADQSRDDRQRTSGRDSSSQRAPNLTRSVADRPQRHLIRELCQSPIVRPNAVKLVLTLASIAVSAAALISSTPLGPSTELVHSPETPVLASTTGNSPRLSLTAC
jgi:hypothetical protein